MQSAQPVQADENSASAKAQGGRRSALAGGLNAARITSDLNKLAAIARINRLLHNSAACENAAYGLLTLPKP